MVPLHVLPCLVGVAALAILFYYAMTRDRLRIYFYVGLMTASACLVVAGLIMINRSAMWEGVVLICVGLALSLGTMVAAQKPRS